MATYELAIEIDSEGVRAINAAQQLVTIVKSVETGVSVAWVSFHPTQMNTVSWSGTYSVYSSTSTIQSGAPILPQTTTLAVGGNTYTLIGGQFSQGQSDLPATTYGVHNDDPTIKVGGALMITSGLYQGAQVNGVPNASPLNAAAVGYRETGTFTPAEQVSVFTSRYPHNGLVVSEVPPTALVVDLTSDPAQKIHYDDATNKFVLGAL